MSKKKEAFSWVMTIVIAVILAMFIKTFIAEVAVVHQSSMYPTLEEGDRLVASKISYVLSEPKFDDICVIKISNDKDYVKRIIGLPGDTLEIRDSRVYINGNGIYESYIEDGLEYEDYPLTEIPKGYYFVMGDNRDDSIDSRDESIGLIKREKIISKIIFRITPFSRFGNVN